MGGVQEDVYDGPEGGGRDWRSRGNASRYFTVPQVVCRPLRCMWGRQTLSFKRFRVLSVLPQTHFRRKREGGGSPPHPYPHATTASHRT